MASYIVLLISSPSLSIYPVNSVVISINILSNLLLLSSNPILVLICYYKKLPFIYAWLFNDIDVSIISFEITLFVLLSDSDNFRANLVH